MSELDPVDLVRTLNEQGKDERNDGRPNTRSKPGGVAHVGPNDTIGLDTCWCGRPNGHDWPGRDERAPHPRYPD